MAVLWWGCRCILVGTKARNRARARAFGAWLEKLTGVPVDFFDERYTSSEAEAILGEANLSKKKRKARLDQLAAQIMLTAYLEARAKGQDSPGGIE